MYSMVTFCLANLWASSLPSLLLWPRTHCNLTQFCIEVYHSIVSRTSGDVVLATAAQLSEHMTGVWGNSNSWEILESLMQWTLWVWARTTSATRWGPDPRGMHFLKTGTNPYSWPYPTHEAGSWPNRLTTRAIFVKTGWQEPSASRQDWCTVFFFSYACHLP